MSRKRNPNGAGTLYKESVPGRAVRWVSEAYVTLGDGRRVRVRGRGPTPEGAIAERVRRALDLDRANPNTERLTVRQLSERWVTVRQPSWKQATVYSYRVSLDRHILPEIGAVAVTRVGALDAERVLNRVMRVSHGKHVAAANRARRVMHALFAYAVDVKLIRENPIDGVRSIRAEPKDRGWWTRGQAVAFLAAASRSPYRDLFHTAIDTGLRQGELLALRWADLTDAGVTVRRTFSRHAAGKVQESPKTSASRRTVPIGLTLRARLETRRGRPDALVFPTRTGGLLNPSNLNRALRRYAIAAGVPVLKFHDLRRTYASLLAADGYHPSVIQRHLGHSSPELAMRVYTSVSDANAATAVVDVLGSTGGNSGGSVNVLGRSELPDLDRVAVVEIAPDTLN